jgi:spoIIIJ-associated protein
MRSVVGEGGTIDEAIAEALAVLGVGRERVEIEIIENAARGVLGIGRRKARVRATIRAPLRDLLDGAATAPASAGPLGASDPSAEPARDRPPHDGPSASTAAAFDAVAFLGGLLRRMRFDLRVRSAPPNGVALDGPDRAAAIGRRGEVLDALEHVVNRVAERAGVAERIVLDGEGYRARRKARLEDLARRVAERARRRGKPVTINPLSPADRRIVYAVLAAERGVGARSLGQGVYRKLVIIPGGVRRGGGTKAG